MTDFDKRRRQYFPLAVTFAHGNTGVRLKKRFGRDGLLVWVCYLTACKTNWIQGQFSYTSEPDGWTKLGLYGYEPEFSLSTFFTFTGHLKQTRRTRSGDLVDVICTQWEAWNKEFKRDRDASEKSRKRGGNTATMFRLPDEVAAILRATEVDVEVDVDANAATKALWESIWKCAVSEAPTMDAAKLAAKLHADYGIDEVTAMRVAGEAKAA